MKHFLLTFVAIFSLMVPFSMVQAIGVSPTPIQLDNAANGIRVERKVQISLPSADKATLIGVEKIGEGARYIELTKEEFVIPAGRKTLDYSFFIAPQAAPNGTHEAIIIFTDNGQPGELGSSGASARAAIGVKILFTVTDEEVKAVNVTDVQFEDTEVGLPLTLVYKLENAGNVDIRIDTVDFSVVDVTDETHTYTVRISGDVLEIIAPGETKYFQHELDERLPQGKYLAKAVFYSDGEKIYTKEGQIEVHPPGTLSQSVSFEGFDVDKKSYTLREPVEVVGVIKNTGKTSVRATFYTKVQRDGEFLDTLRSSEVVVPVNQTREIYNTFRLDSYGEYIITGYIDYGGQRTEEKNTTISLLAPKANVPWVWIIAGIGAVGIVAAVLVFIKKFHTKPKKKKKSK